MSKWNEIQIVKYKNAFMNKVQDNKHLDFSSLGRLIAKNGIRDYEGA